MRAAPPGFPRGCPAPSESAMVFAGMVDAPDLDWPCSCGPDPRAPTRSPLSVAQVIYRRGGGGVETAAEFASRAGLTDLKVLRDGRLIPNVWQTALQIGRYEMALFSLWKTLPTMILARLFHPMQTFVVSLSSDRPAHPVDAAATWAMCRLASEVWGDCEETVRRRRRTVGSKQVRIVSHLLREPQGPFERASSPSFVYWGRLAPGKRIECSIDLIRELRTCRIPATLHLIGDDGGSEHQLRRMAATLPDGSVRFHGRRTWDEIVAIARSASFFVLASRQEGASLAALEALQLGLVPIVSPVGALETYSRLGHRFESASGAALWVRQVLAMPEHLRALSMAARQYADSRQTFDASLAQAIRRAIGRKGKLD